jgi:hypothetical protein
MMSWPSSASFSQATFASLGAGRLERLDAILDLGVLAVQDLERRDVLVLLVGDEALEAVAVHVVEAQLRAGVRALAPADETSPLGPALEVHPIGQLGHPRALRSHRSPLNAGRQAFSGSRRIASRAGCLMA